MAGDGAPADGAHAGTLPSPRARLIGRGEEIAHLEALIGDPTVRLVTLCGRSGVGKTVLAHEVARRILDRTPVTVLRVDVDASPGPSSVARVRSALATGAGPLGSPPAGRSRVVVLDGVDGTPTIAPLVSQALDRDPDLTVVATSTSPLAVHGEHLVRVRSLAVPGAGERRPDAALATPAVELLRDRIAAHDADFTLDGTNVAAVVALCRALEGLPLAIELVAPRSAALGVAAIADHLGADSPLRLLDGGPRDLDERHRSLRATIAWSYQQLTDGQQELLRLLGVFAGPFRWETVAELLSSGGDGAARLDDLRQLVTVGMVDRLPGRGDQADRYQVPPTIGAFARDDAAALGGLDGLTWRHAEHRRIEARRLEELAPAGRLTANLDAVAEAADHLAALDVVRERGSATEALRYAVDLAPPLGDAGMAAAALDVLCEELDRADRPPGGEVTVLEVEALGVGLGLSALAGRAADRGVELRARLDALVDRLPSGPVTDAELRSAEGRIELAMVLGELDEAEVAAQAALDRASGATARRQARLLSWGAAAANQRGGSALALERIERAGAIAAVDGDERQQFRCAVVAMGIPGATGFPPATVLAPWAGRLGDHAMEGPLLVAAALELAMAGDRSGALGTLSDAFDLAQRRSYWHVESLAVIGVTLLAAFAGRSSEVARLRGGMDHRLALVRRVVGPEQLRTYEAVVSGARDRMGAAAFDAGAARGRVLGWSAVLDLARQVLDELADAEPSPGSDATGADEGQAAEPPRAATPPLTDRELVVLRLLADGLANKQIAAELAIRPKTVMHHTSHIYRKLGVAGRTEAVSTAWRMGLLDAQVSPPTSDRP
jgi:predicted ATPase/DNA-binding CsgD family transcriptional regulator